MRFRKRLFVDGLGWTLACDGDVERDEFDTEAAVYCSLSFDEEVIGGWRALRTTEPYLGKTIFPGLASLRPYPCRPDIWEISRLGVLPHARRSFAARLIYALMLYFAKTRELQALVGVVDVAHGRNLAAAGINLRRYGPPQVVGHGRGGKPIEAFLAELRPDDQRGRRFQQLAAHTNFLEIRDEALTLGPARISA